MKITIVSRALAFGAFLVLFMPVPTGMALPMTPAALPSVELPVIAAQHTSSRGFRRCMRAKYGPKYFRGVKRAHRYFMAQACGG
jgi:hypothetical protein